MPTETEAVNPNPDAGNPPPEPAPCGWQLLLSPAFWLPSRPQGRLLLLALLSVLSVLLMRFVVMDRAAALIFVKHWSYPLATILVLSFAYGTFQILRKEMAPMRLLIPAHRAGCALAVFGAIFLQLHEPQRYKILYDEFVLCGTAMNMHFHGEAAVPAHAHDVNGHLTIVNSFVDKRPVLFPSVLALVHDLTGFRSENVFYLNAFLGGLFLLLLYAVLFLSCGREVALLGQGLFLTLPLLAQNATGGGYELLNLVLILSFFLSGLRYWKKPAGEGLDFFLLSALLLATTRYESILFTLSAAGIALIKWSREGRLSLTTFAALSPLFLLLPLSSNLVFMSQEFFFQTDKDNFFNLVHFPENFGLALVYFFDFTKDQTNSPLLAALGIPGLLLFLLRLRRAGGPLVDMEGSLLMTVALMPVILFNTALALSNHWGQWIDPMVPRFSLPFQLLMVLCGGWILRMLLEVRPGWAGPSAAALVLYALFWTVPVNGRHFMTNELTESRAQDWLRRVVHELPGEHPLIVSAGTTGVIMEKHAALPVFVANRRPERLAAALDDKFYDIVYFFEVQHFHIRKKEWVPAPGHVSPSERFERELLREVPLRQDMRIRLSKLTGLRPPVEIDSTPTHPADRLQPAPERFENLQEFRSWQLQRLP